jgi:hypothetical protein
LDSWFPHKNCLLVRELTAVVLAKGMIIEGIYEESRRPGKRGIIFLDSWFPHKNCLLVREFTAVVLATGMIIEGIYEESRRPGKRGIIFLDSWFPHKNCLHLAGNSRTSKQFSWIPGFFIKIVYWCENFPLSSWRRHDRRGKYSCRFCARR